MFPTIVEAIVGTYIYLNIGGFFGHLNWKIYEDYEYDNIWRKILWPISEALKDVLCGDKDPPISYCAKKQYYETVMSIFWILKPTYLIICWFLIGVCYCVINLGQKVPGVIMAIIGFINLPMKKILKLSN